jgi:cytochrome d ubiquinol oxidase subunit I
MFSGEDPRTTSLRAILKGANAMDVELLARIQFALTIMFHYLFPPLTIGMSVIMVYLEAQYLRTNDKLYYSASRFWTKLFALNFALGVATGIVMEFQFGTNWATYSRFVGDVFGSALAAEGIFAFFIESGFLAVLVFGWDRVSKGMHFFSTCMVSLGSIFSSIWIVVANSWQQTPAGHHIVPVLRNGEPWIVDGEPMMRAEIVDFWAMVFNPSSVIRLSHTLVGCFIMGAFFVMSISAWYLLKNRHTEFAKRSFKGALVFGAIFSCAALFTGHYQAINVYEYQPAKLAAFEGHYTTGKGALTLFGVPQQEPLELKSSIGIPGGLGLLLFGDPERSVIGLDSFRPEDRPPLLIPFLTWRTMVGIGSFFILLTLGSLVLLLRGALFNKRWLLWVFVISVLPAVAANQVGWIGAEVGRQPWIVHPPITWESENVLALDEDGYAVYDESQGLRTSDALSKVVKEEQVLTSLVAFSFIYMLLFALWLYLLDMKIKQGPENVQ